MPPLDPDHLPQPTAPASPKPTAAQKALAAAFLAHQVEELQNKVDGMSVRGGRGGRGRGSAGGGSRARGGHGSLSYEPSPSSSSAPSSRPLFDPKHPGPPPQRQHRGPSASTPDPSHQHQHHHHHHHQHHLPSSQHGPDHHDRPARPPMPSLSKGSPLILDASALVHAFPVIRAWVSRKENEIIIPSEVLHTLDHLKKGDSPLSHSVRAITRYLETHLSPPPAPASASAPVAEWTGLRVSLPAESSPPVSLPLPEVPAPPTLAPAPSTASLIWDSPPASAPAPLAPEPPKLEAWQTSVLSVPTYFSDTGASPILIVSSPYPTDDPAADAAQLDEEDPYQNHLRAEGTVIVALAEKHGVETFWVEPTRGLGPPPKGEGGEGRGGRGGRRGRGRGERVRGGGRGGRDEYEREDRGAGPVPPGSPRKIVLMKRSDGPAAAPPTFKLMKRGEE